MTQKIKKAPDSKKDLVNMKRFIPIQALRTATDITRHVSKIATDINRLTTRQA